MIVKDAVDLIKNANLTSLGLSNSDIFQYHLPLNYKALNTFLLATEIYSLRGGAGSNRTSTKIEEVQITLTYDDDTEPESIEDKINEILEEAGFEHISGYHHYEPELAKLQSVLKYKKIKIEK